jgi:pantoate--beta-alanine ligase
VLLSEVLRDTAARVAAGGWPLARLERAACERLEQGGFRVDYVAVRRGGDLRKPRRGERGLRVLAAAWLGETRLIDNWPVP